MYTAAAAAEGDGWKDFEDIVQSNSAIIKRLTAYAERLAITNESSKGGHVFVNGKYMTLNDVGFSFLSLRHFLTFR